VFVCLDAVEEVVTYGVSVLDTGVNDIRAGTSARRVIKDVVGGTGAAVRDASQTPRRTSLGGVGIKLDSGILLDEVDL
jgi:hypothetical protein